jgi:hypothetical protein
VYKGRECDSPLMGGGAEARAEGGVGLTLLRENPGSQGPGGLLSLPRMAPDGAVKKPGILSLSTTVFPGSHRKSCRKMVLGRNRHL